MDDQPHIKSSALITIDVQHDFSRRSGRAYIEGTEEVLPKIETLLDKYRKASRPIVHVIRLYELDGSNAELSRKTLIESTGGVVAPGSDGSQLDTRLVPGLTLDHEALMAGEFQDVGSAEWVMFKPRWGAFFGTGLQKHLEDLDVDTAVFAGANFPNCPRTSIYEASERDFRAVVVTDAVSRIYDRGIEECRGIGVRAMTIEEIAAELSDSLNSTEVK